ncbi:glucose 1-dehydrogenase [Paenibacillus sp. TAB 01]|uniref:glucose 1-dehydrogenase n=1 Tax=Paenibacillus sp. TAB 01 TaxID=3368988 RepID=UPI0037525A91
MKLQNKVAVVTGARSGMGRAIAELYAREGAKVVVADLNQANIDTVVESIVASGGEAVGVTANVAKDADVTAMVETAVRTFGSIDVLVNNAGIMDNFVPVADVTDELWERVLGVNLYGPFYACRAALKHMVGQESGGVIINNASVGGLFGARGGSSYVTSKHGVIGLTKSIAATYGRDGKIRCNAIAPGAVNTNIGSTITAPHPLGLAAQNDTGPARTGDPMDIARVALFLASDDAGFVNGDVVKVDGGWTAR